MTLLHFAEEDLMNCSKAALSCLRVKSLQYEFGQITKMANFKYRDMFLPYGNMVILGFSNCGLSVLI